MPGKDFCQVEIFSTFAQAKDLEDRVVAAAAACGYHEEIVFGLRLSLEEALVNAIRHGNRFDNTKKIRARYLVTADRADIYLADEGKGFNPKGVPDPTLEQNLDRPTGRGIMLMRAYMSLVEYNEQGNEVHLVKLNKAG